MAANTNPIFTLTPNITVGQTITTANTAKDGTGTVVIIYTAGANGGYVYKVNFQPLGTNIATAARVFINNGSTNTTATNNSYYVDATLASSALSEVATMASTQIVTNIALPAGYRLLVTIGTTVAAGYAVQAVAEDY